MLQQTNGTNAGLFGYLDVARAVSFAFTEECHFIARQARDCVRFEKRAQQRFGGKGISSRRR